MRTSPVIRRKTKECDEFDRSERRYTGFSPIRSASDVARLINTVDSSVSHARMIVLLALGGVFSMRTT